MKKYVLAALLPVSLLPLSSFAHTNDEHTNFNVGVDVVRPISLYVYDVSYGNQVAPAPGQSAVTYHKEGWLKLSGDQGKVIHLSLDKVKKKETSNAKVVFYAYFSEGQYGYKKSKNVILPSYKTYRTNFQTEIKIKPGAHPGHHAVNYQITASYL
ncbi:hypothetical protein AVI51_01785 [Piscirickettsia salmonis]|uniref:Uncharacterized protein n=1 Tax=Piscirickettsia salmonis TaxID=1238 RepID=A0A9Q6LR45_PISSA|nr:hypothetical protein [Piscirickettsia salmonis]ALA24786.1 peptidylprolyl isomerase [Piscirickettsia salmonis]APS45111.1 hypothetical protein AVI48_12495 [Piscirickettsia salmonis]APS48471.1 hypothetical protein AVI49_13105 [Piscirickettsia salmonis]APS49733.1 hypothetical protein AVI50_01830 [Piscirickettsia salmonis]APS52915.1 hypothetical protein AVI51_01785 [Piscirickettsia salmonis]